MFFIRLQSKVVSGKWSIAIYWYFKRKLTCSGHGMDLQLKTDDSYKNPDHLLSLNLTLKTPAHGSPAIWFSCIDKM